MAFKSYDIDFILSAHDRMSKVIKGAVAQSMTKLERLEKTTGRISRRFGRMGMESVAMGTGVAAALAVPTERAIDFEDAIARLGAVSGIIDPANETLKQLEATALQMGKTTQFSAAQAAEGMQFLAMAGFTAEQNMKALPAVLNLAAASSTDLALASDIASDVMSGFGLQAEDMVRVTNALGQTATTANTTVEGLGEAMKFVGPIAKQAGVSIEDVAASAGLLANVGIKGSQAGTTLRSMLLRLSAPTGKASSELQKLGIQTRDSEGNVRSMTTIIGELTEATENMGSGARLASLKTIFGEEPAAGVAELISQGQEGINKQLERMQGAATVEQVAERMSQTTKGQMKQLASAVEGAAISFGKVLLPAIVEITERLKSMAAFLDGLITEYPLLTKYVGLAAAGFAAFAIVGGGASLAIAGVSSAAGVAASAMGALGTVVTFLSGVFRAFTAVLVANPIIAIITAIAVAAYLIYDNWDAVSTFFIKLWDKVTWVFSTFVNYITRLPSRMYAAGVAMFTAIWEGIQMVAAQLFEWLKSYANFMLMIFNPANWVSAGTNIILGIWEGIKGAASWLLEKAASIGQSIASALNPFNWFDDDEEQPKGQSQNPISRQMTAYEQTGLETANRLRENQDAGLGVTPILPRVESGPVSRPSNSNSISVNSPMQITINGNPTPQQQEEFASMLKKNRGLMVKEIEKAQRNNERKKY